MDNLQQTYEQTLYPDLAFPQTHPDRLATIATLLGMQPADPTRCRVLELGSASGGNIIPMAYSLPQSQFIGLDFTARQVTKGQAMISELGLTNVSLRHMNILDVTAELGQFDYIIAHGIYSWVPSEVRDHLLRICQQNLAPQGVAYISYNAYPGWHMLGIIREMMLFHTRNEADPKTKAADAKEILQFLVRSVPAKDTSYGRFLQPFLEFLQEQLERVGSKADDFLLHDELELINDAVYFHQFIDHAARYELQYLAEAELHSIMPNKFPPEVITEIQGMAGNIIEMEQYMDFVRNRVFRQTLLCHEDVTVNRTMRVATLRNFHIASRATFMPSPLTPLPLGEGKLDNITPLPLGEGQGVRGPNLYTPSVEQFKAFDGATLSVEHPVSKTAIAHLIKIWPQLLPFDELLGVAREEVRQHNGTLHEIQADAHFLAVNLLQAYTYSSQLVEFHSYAPAFTLQLNDYPLASAVARYQAKFGMKVTNLYQEGVTLNPLNSYLLQRLDGQHSLTQLRHELMQLVQEGRMKINPTAEQRDQPLSDLLATKMNEELHWLAQAALLIRN